MDFPTEIVISVPEKQMQDHFYHLYDLLAETKLIPEASFEPLQGGVRCLSGVPYPFHNAVFNACDSCIEEQIAYFKKANMPFMWCLSREAPDSFHEILTKRGFQSLGVIQGVMGPIQIFPAALKEGCTIELVTDESTFEEFYACVSSTFGLSGEAGELFKKVLEEGTKHPKHPLFHFALKNKGRVVSVLTTMVEGEIVSFWNGATLEEERKQGFSTELRKEALKHAAKKGASFAASYLMPDRMALHICEELGLKPVWHFTAYLPNSNGGS